MSQGDPESLKMGYGRLDPITQSLTDAQRQILNAIPPTERSIIATLRQQLADARATIERMQQTALMDTQQLSEALANVAVLREALTDVRHALQFANDTPGGGIVDTLWMMHRPETVFDFIDATLERTK